MLTTLVPAADASSAPSYTYAWTPSPLEDDEGHPLAPPAHYEVWLQRDDDPAVLVATVASDTTFTFLPEAEGTYRLRVCAVDSLERESEPSEWSDPLVIPRTVDAPAVTNARLAPPAPNPCNPATTLRYAVPDDLTPGTPLRLQVLDARGALVRTFAADAGAGWHEVRWEGRDDRGRPVASGTYLVRFACGRDVQVSRVTLVK